MKKYNISHDLVCSTKRLYSNATSVPQWVYWKIIQGRCCETRVSLNVGESQITQSLKVRDLGVTFDQFPNFDDYITAICRSTYFHIRNIGKN